LIGIFEDKGSMLAVRQAALEGIGRIGDKAEPAVPVLARALKEIDAALRRAAAVALGQVGGKAKDAWPAVKDAFHDSDNGVRNQVIRLTGSLGKDHKEAVTLLMAAAEKDVNLENRLAALQELGQLESAASEALPLLTRLVAEDARTAIREAALAASKR